MTSFFDIMFLRGNDTMYTIEYYAKERKSLEKLTETCNIRSLTIDVSDIYAIINSEEKINSFFNGLMAHMSRIPSATKVRIYNGNSIGAKLIYSIINTEWLINKDNFKYSEELLSKLIEEAYVSRKVAKKSLSNSSYQERIADGKIIKLKHYITEVEKFKNLDRKDTKDKLMTFGISKKRI